MKNLTRLFVAVAVLFISFACTTDVTEDLGVNLGGQTTLTLSLEESRTQLGEKTDGVYPLYWSEGDQISVNGAVSNLLSAEEAGKASATFAVSGVTYPYSVVYPASEANVVTFLASQEYVAGTFAAGAAPMYGYAASADETIQMRHLVGALRFDVSGAATLSSLVVESESGNLAGTYAVDCATGALEAVTTLILDLSQSRAVSNSITLSFGEGLALTTEATPIYVAVPAGEYGLVTVTLNATSGEKMVAKFDTSAKAISAGMVREFAPFTFVANVTEGDVAEIDSKEALIAFAANPTKSATVTAAIDMTGVEWTPIENYGAFTFDGGNFEIKGLTAPLFGTTSAKIKNVKLVDVAIVETKSHAIGEKSAVLSGALAYYLLGGSVENCYASGSVEVNNTTHNAAEIIGDYYDVCLGGMIGILDGATMTNCENHINLTLTSAWDDTHTAGFSVKAGAMIGMVANASEISLCQNYGNIVCELAHAKSKAVHMGALLGGTSADGSLVVFRDCTNYGNFSVSAKASRQNAYYVGGVAGYLNKGITEFKNLTNLGCGEMLGKGNGQEYRIGGLSGAINSIADNLVNGSKDDASKGCIRVYTDEAGKNGNVYLAGMAYASAADISNSKNYGKLTIEGYAANTYLAGILGTNSWANIINCENHGTLVHNLKVTAVTNIGGILAQAYVAADNTRDIPVNITGCKNTGNIVYNVAADAVHSGLRVIGGIYGYGNLKNKLIPVNIVNCSSSGIMTVKDASNKDLELAFGAIHAYTQYGTTVTIDNTIATTKMYVGYDVNLETGVATPIEGHTFVGKMKAAGFHAMFSAATICTGCDFAGEINIHGKFTKNDQIQIGGYGGYGTGMWTLTNCKFSGKILLTDKTSFESSASKYAVISGFLGYPANDKDENVQIFKNCSLTKTATITCGAQHTNGDLYIGGYIAYTAKKTLVEFLGCHNHATMVTTSSSSATEDLCLGSYIGWKGGGVTTLKGCTNDGNIIAEGKTFKNIYVSGVIAGSSVSTIVKDSEYPQCYNAGNITVGNKTGEKTIATTKTAVGGYVAYHSGGAITSDIYNSGNITVSNLKSPSLYVGGVFGHLYKAGAVNSDAQLTNTGDISISGIDVPNDKAFVGGIVGDTLSPIAGAQSYCTITAENLTNMGWIMGTPRAAETLATNCKVGGIVLGDYDTEDEVYKEINIDNSNFFEYIYGGTTDWSGVDNYDGCTALAAKPTI